ncbi:resolvase [Methylobacterium tarhaniae]|uniref:Resolvase n=1 Tax=Methylobacterium tarhaniae TaxID=1187852 RepID=A0A0J6T6J9_9HYPH|nr:recombinase family protein [Methylobacterium tarhaniae]KMO41168.1 resolvase [Methylobacterium tarhaniae]
MAQGKFVSYLRVSTAKQGSSGLGLEAQRKAVEDYLNGGRWSVIEEVIEVESGKRSDRPKLAEALRLCRIHGATLVIAKLDRLSRDAAFLMKLQNDGVKFVAADMPQANHMVVGILAVVAQAEREMISARTKAALWAAKARGVKLGGYRGVTISPDAIAKGRATRAARAQARAEDLGETIKAIQAEGITSLSGVARVLNERGIPTLSGKGRWQAVSVQRVLARL